MRILALVVKRVFWFFPTILGLLVLTFVISHIIPADPVAFAAGETASHEQIEALRKKFGYDKPLYVQLYRYILAVMQGDLGVSLYTERSISEDLFRLLPATIELTLVSIFLTTVFGIPLGVISALKRNSLFDHGLRVLTVSGLAVASFWLAIQLQLLFAMELDVLPLHGRIDGWGPETVTGFFLIDSLIAGDMDAFVSSVKHLVLPALTLSIPAAATVVRFTRAGVLNAINSNYVFYEVAMGFPRSVIVWKYVLRNALVGTIAQIGLIFGILLAGAVVVEAVFDWPGLGFYAVQSILLSDYNAIMGFTLLTGTMFVIVNLLTDITHDLIDPRASK